MTSKMMMMVMMMIRFAHYLEWLMVGIIFFCQVFKFVKVACMRKDRKAGVVMSGVVMGKWCEW